MKNAFLLPIALFASLLIPVSGASAQTTATRIAVADATRIFNEMQETKEAQKSMGEERDRLNAIGKEKADEVRKLQAERDQIKPDSPKYDELNEKLTDTALDFKLWQAKAQSGAERNQKRQIKSLFAKVEAAVAEIAKRDGYDLVLTKVRPELPANVDNINYDQIVAALSGRNVLYSSPKVDISDAVIALLDSKYKGKGGAAAAPAGGGTPKKPAGAAAPRPPAE
jgi:Skp family chaperone for outer membrane proteins